MFTRSLLSLVIVAALSPAALAADNYKIDPVHSSVHFRIGHGGIAFVYGRFNDVSGTVAYDKEDPTKSSFNIEIKADSVDTNNEKRDAHLRSPDFFDAKQFPTITFKSTKVESAGEDKLNVTGDLTLHGVTKEITVPVTKTGEADLAEMKMGYRTGWEAIVDIKRSDFGMTTMVGPVGDEVKIPVALEAVKE